MKASKKWTGVGLGCALAVTLGASVASPVRGTQQKANGSGPEVKIDNFTFTPNALNVSVGTTVQWVNRDDIPHTVVSDDKTTFKSKALDSDDNYSYTFTKAGTYNYFCSIHPKMTGKVVVQ